MPFWKDSRKDLVGFPFRSERGSTNLAFVVASRYPRGYGWRGVFEHCGTFVGLGACQRNVPFSSDGRSESKESSRSGTPQPFAVSSHHVQLCLVVGLFLPPGQLVHFLLESAWIHVGVLFHVGGIQLDEHG